ncbi:MAG: cytochrome c-type biogenesis protein [Sutterellaceae bacterium]|nr:cytochrome c-type biogenesis protein CcmH [Burkholderiaceae bacterium]MCX7901496.1 cytochrome c-type biogenesis protein CcmH [Burkholderiaceae bacterium]MDW8430129.1 cytochrome c-type biogenesis protein [Sutterellaceae bacterium]
MTNISRLLSALLCAFALGGAGANSALSTVDDPVALARELRLAAQLRCLVCQNQSIADSNAELARDLRQKLREQIAAGKSDEEIIAFMTARYGDFVLYRPPFKATTALLWLGPALLLAGGMLLVVRLVKARRHIATELSPEERARAQRLLAGAESEQP